MLKVSFPVSSSYQSKKMPFESSHLIHPLLWEAFEALLPISGLHGHLWNSGIPFRSRMPWKSTRVSASCLSHKKHNADVGVTLQLLLVTSCWEPWDANGRVLVLCPPLWSFSQGTEPSRALLIRAYLPGHPCSRADTLVKAGLRLFSVTHSNVTSFL